MLIYLRMYRIYRVYSSYNVYLKDQRAEINFIKPKKRTSIV